MADGIAGIDPETLKQRQLQAQMMDTERRADLEPFVWDDPVRQLGLLTTQNERHVYGAPDNPHVGNAYYVPSTHPMPTYMREQLPVPMGGLDYYEAMYGDDPAGMYPSDTVYVTDTANDPSIIAHEYGHAGEDWLWNNPEVRAELPPWYEEARGIPGFNEAVVERSDMAHQHEEWNWPDRAHFWDFPEGTPEDAKAGQFLGDTIQQYDEYSPRNQEIVDLAAQYLQQHALKELDRRGVPPKSVPARYRDDYEF